MPNITQYIIEGVDRLGKSSLIEAIIDQKGFHPVIHYQKPKILSIYEGTPNIPEYEYQYATFCNMFQLIESRVPLIFDRGHLGEVVYSEIYRGYDGSYVFDLERNFTVANAHHVKVILLTCNPKAWDKLEDDGQSFNWDNKASEQSDFIYAWSKSIFPNKQIVDVMKEDRFGLGFERKTIDEILTEIGL
jgi:hypothetical protein